MKQLDVNVIFPYNWYHARTVKIYDDKGNLLTKAGHYEYRQMEISDEVKHLLIKIDFYKYIVEVPQNENKLNLAIYLNVRGSLFQLYVDSLKRDFVRGRFMTNEEFRNFDLSFYNSKQQSIRRADVDAPTVQLGIILSSTLIVASVVEQDNPNQDIVFFIGFVSLISLLMIWFEKGKLFLIDYKSRMIATGLAFILGAFFMQSLFPAGVVVLMFSAVFLLRLYRSLQGNNSATTESPK